MGIGQSTGEPRAVVDELVTIVLQQGNFLDTTLFPINLMLPLKVATEIRSARSYTILDKNQDIPVAILNWMRNDSRYSGLFG